MALAVTATPALSKQAAFGAAFLTDEDLLVKLSSELTLQVRCGTPSSPSSRARTNLTSSSCHPPCKLLQTVSMNVMWLLSILEPLPHPWMPRTLSSSQSLAAMLTGERTTLRACASEM